MMVDSEREALAAWERAVLDVLGVEDPPIEAWSRVYDRVSEHLTARAEEHDPGPTALLQVVGGSALDRDAVWGLIYGARSFAIARRLFAETPPAPGLFRELGAGWGPFGVAAAMLGRGVELIDLSQSRLELAATLATKLGLPRPQTAVADARTLAAAVDESIALPYSLGEMIRGADDIAAGARLIERWSAGAGGSGRIYVVEPGTRPASRRLQAIRDAIAPKLSIAAPCTGAHHCPSLALPSDWCHVTWQLPLGPVGQAIAQSAGRRWQEVHFSYLVLGAGPGQGAVRVLEVREEAGRKVHVRACAAEQLITLTALRRHRAAFDRLSSLLPGDLVRLDRGSLEPKGDGLRVASPDAVLPFHVKHPL